MIAGPLGEKLSFKSQFEAAESLEEIGLSSKAAHACLASLERGELVLCVETRDPAEIAITWHTLRELEAEHISLAFADGARSAPASSEKNSLLSTAFSAA